jgi:hypothetical protein
MHVLRASTSLFFFYLFPRCSVRSEHDQSASAFITFSFFEIARLQLAGKHCHPMTAACGSRFLLFILMFLCPLRFSASSVIPAYVCQCYPLQFVFRYCP